MGQSDWSIYMHYLHDIIFTSHPNTSHIVNTMSKGHEPNDLSSNTHTHTLFVTVLFTIVTLLHNVFIV